MAPSIVWDERECLVGSPELTLLVEVECLSVGNECLYRSACDLTFAEAELGILVHQGTHDVEVVIGMFCAVNQWSSLYADHATISCYLVVCTNSTGFHVEVYLYFIAFLPLTTDGIVAILSHAGSNFLTIDLYGVT